MTSSNFSKFIILHVYAYVLRTYVCSRVCICMWALDNFTMIYDILLHRPCSTGTLQFNSMLFVFIYIKVAALLCQAYHGRIANAAVQFGKILKKAPAAYHRNHRTNPPQIWSKILTPRFSLHSHARDNARVIAILHKFARVDIFADAFKSVLAASLLRLRPTLNYTLRRADGSTSACNDITSSFARTHCALELH